MIYPYAAWAEANLNIVSRNGAEWKCFCPNPDHQERHPSCYFNVDKGAWICFSCGFKGSVSNNEDLLEYEMQSRVIKSRLQKMVETNDEEFCGAPESTLNRYKVKHPYWASRGLNADTQELFELGYDAIANAATIPLRTPTGALVGVTRRFLDPNWEGPKYKYPRGFKASQNVFGAWLSEEYDMSAVSMHEGSIDAMRVWQTGMPAVAVYGSSISAMHVRVLLEMGVRKVIYFGDGDKAGQKAKMHTHGYWERSDGSWYYKKDTDLSKHFQLWHVVDYQNKKDAGEMTDQQIKAALDSAVPYTLKMNTKKKKYQRNIKDRLRELQTA